ncbi:hypothetical protein BKA56DRAFT_603477 [Ilyonectria sp. MPI-CAGE-AT-0026]|nr:hypothetical protein BKA56DRAFT_603477 [Ilyonectria sp. MPI-CAGE-AT-0026]
MAVDLERAKFHGRPSLGDMSPNSQTRKRRRGLVKLPRDEFAQELTDAVGKCRRSIR